MAFLILKSKDINSWVCVWLPTTVELPCQMTAAFLLEVWFSLAFHGHSEKTRHSCLALNTLLTTDGKCVMPASLCISQWMPSSVVKLGIPAIILQKLLQLPPSGNSQASWWVYTAYLGCSMCCTLGNVVTSSQSRDWLCACYWCNLGLYTDGSCPSVSPRSHFSFQIPRHKVNRSVRTINCSPVKL